MLANITISEEHPNRGSKEFNIIVDILVSKESYAALIPKGVNSEFLSISP